MRNRLFVAALVASASVAGAQTPVPEIKFDANIDYLKLPAGLPTQATCGSTEADRAHGKAP